MDRFAFLRMINTFMEDKILKIRKMREEGIDLDWTSGLWRTYYFRQTSISIELDIKDLPKILKYFSSDYITDFYFFQTQKIKLVFVRSDPAVQVDDLIPKVLTLINSKRIRYLKLIHDQRGYFLMKVGFKKPEFKKPFLVSLGLLFKEFGQLIQAQGKSFLEVDFKDNYLDLILQSLITLSES